MQILTANLKQYLEIAIFQLGRGKKGLLAYRENVKCLLQMLYSKHYSCIFLYIPLWDFILGSNLNVTGRRLLLKN